MSSLCQQQQQQDGFGLAAVGCACGCQCPLLIDSGRRRPAFQKGFFQGFFFPSRKRKGWTCLSPAQSPPCLICHLSKCESALNVPHPMSPGSLPLRGSPGKSPLGPRSQADCLAMRSSPWGLFQRQNPPSLPAKIASPAPFPHSSHLSQKSMQKKHSWFSLSVTAGALACPSISCSMSLEGQGGSEFTLTLISSQDSHIWGDSFQNKGVSQSVSVSFSLSYHSCLPRWGPGCQSEHLPHAEGLAPAAQQRCEGTQCGAVLE